jgi:hypothetical protein
MYTELRGFFLSLQSFILIVPRFYGLWPLNYTWSLVRSLMFACGVIVMFVLYSR